MNSVDYTECKLWIKSHAYKGPASHVHKNGTYEEKLVKAAKILTDIKDSFLCPDEEEKVRCQFDFLLYFPMARAATLLCNFIG